MVMGKTMKRYDLTTKQTPAQMKKKERACVGLPHPALARINPVDGKVDAYRTVDEGTVQVNGADQRVAAIDAAAYRIIPTISPKKCSIMVRKRIFVQLVFILGLVCMLLISSSQTCRQWPLAGGMLFSMGVVLASIGAIGRLWCSVYIAGYKMNALVMQGPYSLSRNPLYFFSLIGATGVAMATKTLAIPVLVVVAFAAYYPFVIKSEEAELLRQHGKAFAVYCQMVPRFFPRRSGLFEPPSYTVLPKLIRRHVINALWFIWPLGFIQLIDVLHRLKILPTYFWVY